MTQREGRFDGQVACVTGGATGLGAAISHRLAMEGAHVVVADVQEQPGRALAAVLRADRLQVQFIRLDVTSPGDWTDLAGLIEAEYGRMHVLVNNAGIIIRKGLDATSLPEWDRAFAVNVTGAFLGLKHCRRLLAKAGGASVVNVSSTAGLIAHGDPSYTATKWAVRGLTKSAALELVGDAIRVNSVHPAMIDTPLTHAAPSGHQAANCHAIPMGRAATPDEVASVVLFLASSEARFMTGSELAVDGGLTSGGVAWMRSAFQASLDPG